MRQDLNFITEGLKFTAFFYDAYNYHEISRLRQPELYKAEPNRDNHGDLVLRRVAEATSMGTRVPYLTAIAVITEKST